MVNFTQNSPKTKAPKLHIQAEQAIWGDRKVAQKALVALVGAAWPTRFGGFGRVAKMTFLGLTSLFKPKYASRPSWPS